MVIASTRACHPGSSESVVQCLGGFDDLNGVSVDGDRDAGLLACVRGLSASPSSCLGWPAWDSYPVLCIYM